MQSLRMKQLIPKIILVAACLFLISFGFTKEHTISINHKELARAIKTEKSSLYQKLGLAALGLSQEAFTYALNGFDHLLQAGKIRNDNILSILDFSLPSGKKRLFVIDLSAEELVFNTYASHGKNSGKIVPTDFSNQTNSYKSSLGFYITGNTYIGKKGCSLRLEGEELGINNNALNRGIVVHGAAYVNEKIANAQGFVGRSQGCPALPKDQSKHIIDKIKNGSCLFIYSPDPYYAKHSTLIQEAV